MSGFLFMLKYANITLSYVKIALEVCGEVVCKLWGFVVDKWLFFV